MIEPTRKLLRDPSLELVFGLAAPVGTDLERLEADLIDHGVIAQPATEWRIDRDEFDR